MEQQNIQQNNYRKLLPIEVKRIKKKAIPMITCGIICLVFGIGSSLLISSIFSADDVEGALGRKLIMTIGMLVFMLLLGVSFCLNDIKLIIASKDMMVAVVNVGDIKVKPGGGFRYRANIQFYENGVLKNIEAPIMVDAVDTVSFQKQAKLYFVPEKYYILDRVDS